MQSNIQNQSQWLSASTFIFDLFKSLFRFFKALSAPICGLGSALLDLYDIYKVATNANERNRKTKIISSLFSFAGNVVYSIASIVGFLNPMVLASIAFSTAIPPVYKEGYAAYAANTTADNNNDAERAATLREERFINKCNITFKALKLVGNVCVFAGFLFPPLSILGTVIVGLATIIENYDKRNNYRISKACCYYGKKLWNGICDYFIPKENSAATTPLHEGLAIAPITQRSTRLMQQQLTSVTELAPIAEKKEATKPTVKFSNINERVRWHLQSSKPTHAQNDVMPATSSLRTVQCTRRQP